MTNKKMISADSALQRLVEGNGRFVNNQSTHNAAQYVTVRAQLTKGQAPFAIVLGCADSRVPPELIFDQGLGDLFVIRVAGNVADTAVSGSIEYAAEHLGTPLLVVLGHSSCGAVRAAISKVTSDAPAFAPDLAHVVEMIAEGIRPLFHTPSTADPIELESQAIQQNVKNMITQLQAQSECLRQRVANGQLHMIGAHYMLNSGEVHFLDTVSADAL